MAISNRSTSDTLTAAHYNELRNKIVQILGAGSGDFGYGQTTISNTVAGSSTQQVNATHMTQLRTDIVKAYVHITSTAFNLTSPVGSSSIIKATDSGAAYNETHNAYIQAINYCETNRFASNPSQMTLISSTVPKTVASNWNGSVTVAHTITFSSADHRRWFFNAGGQLRFYASHDNNSTGKSNDWQQFLANKVNGTIYDYNQYWAAIGGTTTHLQKNAGDFSSVYSDNYWNVTTAFPNASSMTLTQTFADADIGNRYDGPHDVHGTAPYENRYWIAAYDEAVTGTTSVDVGVYYPTGSTTDAELGSINTVQLASPTIA